jgi:hypothetical protein
MNAPGLPSLNASRRTRHRQVVTGRATVTGIPPRLFGLGILVLVVGGFLYFRQSQAELAEKRGQIMAKQRAIAAELGPRLVPLRDRVESAARELGAPQDLPTFVQSGIDFTSLFGAPGLYLRALRSDTSNLEDLRRAAQESLRDGFTACILRDERAGSPSVGAACRESQACQPGELCNEFGVCARPSSPFNTRLLYRALGVLSEQWTGEVERAGTDLALIAYERGLDSVTEVDIPVAIDVYQRSKYVVIVLDEEPNGGLPPKVAPDEPETDLERVLRAPHQARVGIWSLPEGRPLLKMRAPASGTLRDVGARTLTSAGSEAARARQANSCGLALEVRSQLASPSPVGAGSADPTAAATP